MCFLEEELETSGGFVETGVFGGVGGLTPGWTRGLERRPERSAKERRPEGPAGCKAVRPPI